MICRWCRRPFEPRRRESGGKPQRFCSHLCREDYHATVHRLALAEVEAGRVDLEALQALGVSASKGHL